MTSQPPPFVNSTCWSTSAQDEVERIFVRHEKHAQEGVPYGAQIKKPLSPSVPSSPLFIFITEVACELSWPTFMSIVFRLEVSNYDDPRVALRVFCRACSRSCCASRPQSVTREPNGSRASSSSTRSCAARCQDEWQSFHRLRRKSQNPIAIQPSPYKSQVRTSSKVRYSKVED
jgi:hypothetical protein